MNHYEFEVVLSGYGETPEEAWDEAIEGFSMEPGTFDEGDILTVTKVDEDTYNETEVTFTKPDARADLLEACKSAHTFLGEWLIDNDAEEEGYLAPFKEIQDGLFKAITKIEGRK